MKFAGDGAPPPRPSVRASSKSHPTKQGKFAPPGKPSLRGAQRRLVRRSSTSEATKQSISPLRRDGLLRGACHRARIRATRWLAMTMLHCGATKQPDGQISRAQKPVQPSRKNISLNPSGKSDLQLAAILSRARGAYRDRHERGMGCGGRGSVGAQGDRRAGFAVSDARRADERRCCVRQNRVVLAPVAGVKLRGGEIDPTGIDQPSIRQRR